ncbi:MAG: AMP-binding protein, partial [Salinirussus sp.]
MTVYGCYKIGAVPVPLNYMLAPDTFGYIVDDVAPDLVVYDGEVADRFERGLDKTVVMPQRICTDDVGDAESFKDLVDAAAEAPPDPPTEPDAPAYILYTSGTTGNPKGVVFTAETAQARALEMVSTAGFTQSSVTLQLSPWFHAGGIDNTVHQTVVAGGELIVLSEFEPQPALDAIEQYGVTHIASVPTLTRRIADADGVSERDLSSVECWINMGSPLTQSDAETFLDTLTPNI